jgi:hypothetical protein
MNGAIGLATRGNDITVGCLEFIVESKLPVLGSVCKFSAAIAQSRIFYAAAKKELDYLIFIDSDVTPPKGALGRLLELDKDVITIPVFHYDTVKNHLHLNVCLKENYRLTGFGKGIEEIEQTSFAFMLVSGRVLKKFKELRESFVEWSSLISEEYKDKPSDNIFCAKVRKLGFKMYVNWDIRGSVHHTTVNLSEELVRKARSWQ